MQLGEAKTSKLISDNFRSYEVWAKLLQPELLYTEIYKRDAEWATHTAPIRKVPAEDFVSKRSNAESQSMFQPSSEDNSFQLKSKSQLCKLSSRLSEKDRKEFESQSDRHCL